MTSGTRYNLYEQGDIVIIPFPFDDVSATKRRPALIVSNASVSPEHRICAMITSKRTADAITLTSEDLQSGNLPVTSYIRSHKLFTTHATAITRCVARVTPRVQRVVHAKLTQYISLPK